MPHDSQPFPTAASATPPADLLTELVGMLATVLRLKPEKIDPDQTFRSLGLDSLLTVEYVATVNARCATAVKPDALLDHPTPFAFARHVAGERAVPSAASLHRPAPYFPDLAPAPTPAPAPVPVPVRPPAAPLATAPAAGAVLDVLREELARILCCDPWDIDTTAAFTLLGVDSILGAEFVATVNRIYGLRERAVTLYDHPSLAAMAAHIAVAAPAHAAPAHAAPVASAADSAQAPVSGPRGPVDLNALLDAVREDRISVDAALHLLPRHA